jgi:long-chain acyl-CoA synthetase
MKGYFNKASETKAVMTEDGFFRTGDVGYMDADGFTVIVDRIKDMIIAGGYNVYPSKIEEAIRTHAAVAEVIVAGIKDEYRGETVKAYIVLKDGQSLTADALKEHLKAELSPIEMPKQFEFRDSLPKTMIGKPSRKDLVEEEALKAKALKKSP